MEKLKLDLHAYSDGEIVSTDRNIRNIAKCGVIPPSLPPASHRPGTQTARQVPVYDQRGLNCIKYLGPPSSGELESISVIHWVNVALCQPGSVLP